MPELTNNDADVLLINKIMRAVAIIRYKRELESPLVSYETLKVKNSVGVLIVADDSNSRWISSQFNMYHLHIPRRPTEDHPYDRGSLSLNSLSSRESRGLQFLLDRYRPTNTKKQILNLEHKRLTATVMRGELTSATAWADYTLESIGIPKGLGTYSFTYEMPCTVTFNRNTEANSEEEARREFLDDMGRWLKNNRGVDIVNSTIDLKRVVETNCKRS